MSVQKDVFLVLGGDSFVGGHVVQRLKARGDNVSIFDLVDRQYAVPFYQGDICSKDEVLSAIRKSGATCVIHTISPLSIYHQDELHVFEQVIVQGTKNAIDAALTAGVQKLVYHSSSSVVFDGSDIVDGDETLPYAKNFRSIYSKTRMLAEKAVLGANGQGGLHTAVIRPVATFGVGDRESIPGSYNSWKTGRTHVQLGSENKLFDRTYVSNIALGLVLAADHLPAPSVAGEVFFITNGASGRLPFWDFARAIWREMDAAFPGRTPPAKKRVVIPRWAALVIAHVSLWMAWLRGTQATLTPYTVSLVTAQLTFSDAKARRVLGYEPEVEVEEGLEMTMKWFKNEVDAGRFE
ncbi:3-beta hydroxysteroid dehydrogenase/isomerase family-domain-containing protein [Schizophyllum amplum]|uniref:3-beta hydroxysteroid dehydrogenase/isomerase family-domain-containing protein n=1 Tax=Schizophyllum amplum TaxID=97359 RepID=A0A550CFV8_9AGAR|nr:3-beta hydroxysteroid dehydrogenase/isomerase family-domain-containing protein [Auriculariopsis ampla]